MSEKYDEGPIRKAWRAWRGIHKRTDKGVGGGTGADGVAPAGGILGANGVAPSSTAGYARVALTNSTFANTGAGTSVGLFPGAAAYLGFTQHLGVRTPAEINAWRAAFGYPTLQPPPLRQMGKLTDYVIGWREWRYEPFFDRTIPVLSSLNLEFGSWQPGKNLAACKRMEAEIFPNWHTAPEADCECGFYLWPTSSLLGLWQRATSAVRRTLWDPTEVLGAVRCWGRIIEHGGDGFRAEHAEIVALLDTGEHARAAAKRYGVPCLGADRIESYAYEFGRALPGPDAEP